MNTTKKTSLRIAEFNKPLYVLLLLIGIVLLIRKDCTQALIYWGLALAFDPFDPKLPLPKRPLYQKIWLGIHLLIVFGLVAASFWRQ